MFLPLQCSCLENPKEGGAWWASVYGVTQSQTRLKQLSMRACIGEGNGNPLQYSCLENPRDGGAWWASVYGVAQSRTRLKRFSSSSRGGQTGGCGVSGLLPLPSPSSFSFSMGRPHPSPFAAVSHIQVPTVCQVRRKTPDAGSGK